MSKYRAEDVSKAVQNYMEDGPASYFEGYDLSCIMGNERHDVIQLRQEAQDLRGWDLVDLEVYAIWAWHSSDFDVSWMRPSRDPENNMGYFDEFVERFKDKNEDASNSM